MPNYDGFIPNEMTIAQPHPLASNLTRRLPNPEIAPIEEIRTLQQRDRIPGIVKRLVPLNPLTVWEYWWCVPGRMLLPEDVEVLKIDRLRIEAILSKLVWLLGGHCFGENTPLDRDSSPVYDWDRVLAFVQSCGLQPDLLDIDFLPMAIQSQHTENCVAIEPARWHIEFFQILPIEGGFELALPKKLCSCQIWTGRPFIKNLQTDETITRYDLWISCPHDSIANRQLELMSGN